MSVGIPLVISHVHGSDGHGPTEERSRSAITNTTVPVETAPATTAPLIRYRVRRGDVLSSIARQFRVSIAAIAFANRLTDQDHITEGQTLLIPPPPPVDLVITPTAATTGESVRLELTGAQPVETVTFEIRSPSGTFTGPPHTATSDGKVAATYRAGLDSWPGTYTVIANGDQGSTAQANFDVTPATP